MANVENIVKYTAAELRDLRARGGSCSDLARVRARGEAELERDIAGDPDLRDVPESWYEGAVAANPTPRALLSVRLDADVVDWFRAEGPDYQTRINAVLRAFKAARRSRPASSRRMLAGVLEVATL